MLRIASLNMTFGEIVVVFGELSILLVENSSRIESGVLRDAVIFICSGGVDASVWDWAVGSAVAWASCLFWVDLLTVSELFAAVISA
jgi:hypothetical protein